MRIMELRVCVTVNVSLCWLRDELMTGGLNMVVILYFQAQAIVSRLPSNGPNFHLV